MTNLFKIKNLMELNGANYHLRCMRAVDNGYGFILFDLSINDSNAEYLIIFDNDLNITYQEISDDIVYVLYYPKTKNFLVNRSFANEKDGVNVINGDGREIVKLNTYRDIKEVENCEVGNNVALNYVATLNDNSEILLDSNFKPLSKPYLVIFPYEADNMIPFREYNCSSGIMDINGNVMLEMNYDCMYIAYAVGLPVKYLIIRHNDRYLGISDLQGNICFTLDKPDISNIEYFAEDKFLVEKYDKTCHIITISESEDK